MKILFLGDVVGPSGCKSVKDYLPKIKKEYIDTGKAQLIFIDFPLDLAAFNASKLLHCLDKNLQIQFS